MFDPTRHAILTPAFWLCVAALVVVLLNFIRFRSAPDGRLRPRETLRKILSIPIAVAMSLVAAALALFSVYMSYAAPLDAMADIVSAKRVVRGESAYPEEMADLIQTNLKNEPARWSLGRFFPELREKEEREGQTYLKYQPHPPLSVLVAVPLVAIAGIHAAALMMDLISLIALAIMVILIRKSFALYLPLGAGLAILASTISWSPVLILLRQSQSALFVALLIVLAWFFLRREWVVAAGIPLGIATCLKLYPVYFSFTSCFVTGERS